MEEKGLLASLRSDRETPSYQKRIWSWISECLASRRSSSKLQIPCWLRALGLRLWEELKGSKGHQGKKMKVLETNASRFANLPKVIPAYSLQVYSPVMPFFSHCVDNMICRSAFESSPKYRAIVCYCVHSSKCLFSYQGVYCQCVWHETKEMCLLMLASELLKGKF